MTRRVTTALTLAAVATLTHAQNYSIPAWTTDGGGGSASSPAYTLHAIMGQHDAAALSGPTYTIHGGLLPAAAGPRPCNAADLAAPFGALDVDDVLTFLTDFTAANPAADLAAPDGTFDIDDVLTFLVAFNAGCP